jgi:hypothetical protein
MNRPGPVGMTIILTFAIVAIIEFRTVLAMVGLEVPTSYYFGVATALVVVALGVLYLLTDEKPGNPTRA